MSDINFIPPRLKTIVEMSVMIAKKKYALGCPVDFSRSRSRSVIVIDFPEREGREISQT